jgi:hypothetical protein
VNGGFQPVWLRFAVVAAVIVGVLLAVWLFWALSATPG